ncbi:glutaminyl-peptide cyclotransferase [uncultured Dokdonia sp.]|uniref:glutaminyl-peptide cyclotransferase n=1 Tax=uncultured Dokdonia sp. TaxID=575653 RepID=UPI00262F8FE3|nr:glutaminyl-peptide cyclotransferase [uncultured Dokdonia sp.]
MKSFYKILILLTLSLFIYACEDTKNLTDNYTLQTSKEKNAVVNGNDISFSLKAKKNHPIDSIIYEVDGKKLPKTTNATEYKTTIQTQKLGHKTVTATIYTPEGLTTATTQITVLNTKAPKIYGYKIVNRFPHKTDAYTQGLEFVGDTLYESTGQYGKSKLRKVDYQTGEVFKEIALDNAYFAEGLTVYTDKIYQLTWKENTGFIYNVSDFKKIGTFTYNKSKEGWGLCNDGTHVYKSDGSSKIWTLDANTLAEQSYIEPTSHKSVSKAFNELEFIDGKIYANTYQVASIAIIDPATGAIEGLIDLTSLPKEVQKGLDPQNEVLNGIAYKANEGRLFVTGKHWNTLFEIELVEK